jgi:hypothetical protein
MPPFPHEAVRDLLGIARAMYLCEQGKSHQIELAAIGKQLVQCLEAPAYARD